MDALVLAGDCLSCARLSICNQTSLKKTLDGYCCPLYQRVVEPVWYARHAMMAKYGSVTAVRAMLGRPADPDVKEETIAMPMVPKPEDRVTVSLRRKQLDTMSFMDVRILATQTYKGPDGNFLLTWNDTIAQDKREAVKNTVLNFEFANGLIFPDDNQQSQPNPAAPGAPQMNQPFVPPGQMPPGQMPAAPGMPAQQPMPTMPPAPQAGLPPPSPYGMAPMPGGMPPAPPMPGAPQMPAAPQMAAPPPPQYQQAMPPAMPQGMPPPPQMPPAAMPPVASAAQAAGAEQAAPPTGGKRKKAAAGTAAAPPPPPPPANPPPGGAAYAQPGVPQGYAPPPQQFAPPAAPAFQAPPVAQVPPTLAAGQAPIYPPQAAPQPQPQQAAPTAAVDLGPVIARLDALGAAVNKSASDTQAQVGALAAELAAAKAQIGILQGALHHIYLATPGLAGAIQGKDVGDVVKFAQFITQYLPK